MDQNHISAHSAAKRTYRLPQMKHIFLSVLMLTVSAVMFLSCRGHGSSSVITIKVEGGQVYHRQKTGNKIINSCKRQQMGCNKGQN